MRADSGIIFLSVSKILIYLFKAGDTILKPQSIQNFRINCDSSNTDYDARSHMILVENIIDVVSSDAAAGIYNWKIVFQNTQAVLLREITQVLEFNYEVLNEEMEHELICKGLMNDFDQITI